jgi:tetratricopeptide (TPR) repeat protein
MAAQESAQSGPSRGAAFVGRGRELAELQAALDDVGESQRHLFLVSGEPGIGKTRLVDELAATARARRFGVMWGRCWEGGGAPAYWPWIQVVRACFTAVEPEERRALLDSEVAPNIAHDVAQIVPELRHAGMELARSTPAAQLDPEQARFRLFDSVTNLLKNFARSRAMLIVLDDLHDGDQASLMMLRFFARELAGAPIIVVGTYRDLEVRRSPPLGKMIGELSREARSIPLMGLNEAEVADLVESIAGQRLDPRLVTRLYSATNGNPLYIDGIVRVMNAQKGRAPADLSDAPFSIPGGVREAIHLRLGRLSQETGAILSAAAAIGNEFEARRCQLVGDASAAQIHPLLDEAAVAEVITALGYGRYRFSHALIREALYDDLDSNTRIRLHGKIAAVTEELYRDDLQPHLAELAHHFAEAGITEKAIDYCIQAGDAAQAVFAYDTAISHVEQALAMGESHGIEPARRAAALFRLGAWRFHFFNDPPGLEDMEAALRVYQQLGDVVNCLEVHAQLGVAFAGLGHYTDLPRAQRHYREAQALLRDDTDQQLAARINYGLAITGCALARYDEALSASARALELYEGIGLGGQNAWVIAAKDCFLFQMFLGRQAEAIAMSGRVFDAARAQPDPDTYAWTMLTIGLYRIQMCDPREAERVIRIGVEKSGIPERIREYLNDFRALSMLEMGDIAAAERLSLHSHNTMNRGLIALRKGDLQFPLQIMRDTLAWTRRTGNRTDELTLLTGLLDVQRAIGDHEGAASTIGEILAIYDPSALRWEMSTRPKAALVAVDLGRPEQAGEHLERCRNILAAGEEWLGLAGWAVLAEAVVAAAVGRMVEADAQFEKALAILTRHRLAWVQAEAFDRWGKALVASGDHSRAMEKFDSAIGIYRRCGAGQVWIDRVEAGRPRASRAPIDELAPPSAVPGNQPQPAKEDALFRNEGISGPSPIKEPPIASKTPRDCAIWHICWRIQASESMSTTS